MDKTTEVQYKKMHSGDLEFLEKIVGAENLLTQADLLAEFSSDMTEDLHFPPAAVVFPSSSKEVSEIVNYCNLHKIPITPRGAGTGLSGGCLPVYGGVSLSLKKMNRILEIDERNFQATVEPGVITQEFQNAVAEKGLFYPPDPASKGSCFIGGNLAENSGGPKAVKYGVTSQYVLNLEVVLPNGEIIWTGADTLKNSTGYNLTQLLVGSEGTLGIITQAVFRLIPLPKLDLLMLVPFYSAEQACEAVSAIMQVGVVPSALEFMERDALEFGMNYLPDLQMELPKNVEAHLLVEVDGNDRDVLLKEMEIVNSVVEKYEVGEILFADDAAQKEKLWKLRRSLGEVVKRNSIYKEEDTVVKRAELPKLLKGVKEIGKKYGFQSVCYGHAGDGNLHVNILKADMSDEDWNGKLKDGIREIFKLCKELGGTISGEHGIGWVQKEYMDVVFDDNQLQLQKSIKNLFDPNNIMNPGKIWM